MSSAPSLIPADHAERVDFSAPLSCWTGGQSGVWYFLHAEGAAAEAIAGHALMRRLELGQARGFGSVRVEAQIGESRWRTSVFPNKGQESWMLPVKAAIRKAEGLSEGQSIRCSLTLL